MVELGLADAGPMGMGIGLIGLGLIAITGGLVVYFLTGWGATAFYCLFLGPVALAFGAYLVWVVSSLRDR